MNQQPGGTPFNLKQLTDIPPLLPRVSDTTSPNLQVPIYFIHSLRRPFCTNPRCKCQWQQFEVRRLLASTVEGNMTLKEAARLLGDVNGEGR